MGFRQLRAIHHPTKPKSGLLGAPGRRRKEAMPYQAYQLKNAEPRVELLSNLGDAHVERGEMLELYLWCFATNALFN